MKKMITFTKIGQFRQVIRDVCYVNPENPVYTFPTLTFEGTVKMHGTNAGISYTEEDGLWVQSRKNIITVEKDNAGFAFFVESKKDIFQNWFNILKREGYITTIFGEWCGGNIQKGVALNQLDKMFVIFAVKYTNIENHEDHSYEELGFYSKPNSIYNSNMFPKFYVDIDFNKPQHAQAEIVDLVEKVELECPVGKYFDVSGIGEGIVFCHYDEHGNRDYIFKAKGKKHSSSKVKTVASVDIEKVKSIDAFIEYSVTENRLNQAIEQVFTATSTEPTIKMMGDFLSWVSRDVISEELDTMTENSLEPKDIGRTLGNKARSWFMNYLDKQAEL
ncbi:MAG: RNA ligase family protein [Candidatus Woesearchaeota archaeon]|nr:RNA ligase family protein [Candidatus Woesearchaeota archaeon]